MKTRRPTKTFVIKWFKALMLSPGILFPAGYLLLYLGTNIYLNQNYKKNLAEAFSQASGNTRQISIQSLKTSLGFDSVTLNNIELSTTIPVANEESASRHKITITKLNIPSPEVQKLLYSSTTLQISTKNICDKILAEERKIQ
jgi:hypothetical protein